MSLIPKHDRVSEISTILSNSNLITSVDWSYFLQRFSNEEFRKLVKITLQKYLAGTNDYLKVSKKYT